jgi:hypothetical protein
MLAPQTDALIALREKVISAKASDRADIAAALSADFALWCEATAWTYRVKEIDAAGRERPATSPHTPFVLWDCQRDAAAEVIAAVKDGRDVVVRKTRDMGASWLLCAIATWGWMFHGWQSLLVSRVEDLVDRTGDPDSLFWKVDYLIASQPEWLLPAPPDKFVKGGDLRQHMMLRHPVTGATVAGQASTEHIGRGGRRTLVIFDEFAALADADAAWRSAADCTSCRIACSTPIGAGTEYARLVSAARTSGEPRLVELMYWQHPEKGAGQVTRTDGDGSVTGFVGATYRWSPWLADQLRRRDRIDLAQNIFAESIGSGAAFFPSHIVTQHKEANARQPRRCEIVAGRLEQQPQGRWRVWASPDRVCEYVVFLDPSYGTGNANAAACVMNANTREVVAEFVDPNLPAYDLALEIAQAMRKVFRGRREAMIGWETNGAGASLQHDFDRAGWKNLYRQRAEGTTAEQRTMRVGWTSTKRAKRSLLGNLSRQMAQGECTVRSEECLNEMLEYVVLDDGSIEAGSRRDEASGARESHGDRVIALAGALMLCEEVGQPIPVAPEFAEHTLGSLLKHEEIRNLRPIA